MATAMPAAATQLEFIVANVKLPPPTVRQSQANEFALLLAAAYNDPMGSLALNEKRHDKWMPQKIKLVDGALMAEMQPACMFCVHQDLECMRHVPIKKLKEVVMKYHANQRENTLKK